MHFEAFLALYTFVHGSVKKSVMSVSMHLTAASSRTKPARASQLSAANNLTLAFLMFSTHCFFLNVGNSACRTEQQLYCCTWMHYRTLTSCTSLQTHTAECTTSQHHWQATGDPATNQKMVTQTSQSVGSLHGCVDRVLIDVFMQAIGAGSWWCGRRGPSRRHWCCHLCIRGCRPLGGASMLFILLFHLGTFLFELRLQGIGTLTDNTTIKSISWRELKNLTAIFGCVNDAELKIK